MKRESLTFCADLEAFTVVMIHSFTVNINVCFLKMIPLDLTIKYILMKAREPVSIC